MIRKVITLMAAGTLACGSLIYLQAKDPGADCPAGGPHHMMGNPLEHLGDALDLTADQKTKVQPIIDQAKPQIEAIHHEAMEKMHTVMQNAGTLIRPLLTATQQQKFDAMKQAHENMRNAKSEAGEQDSKGPGPGPMHHMMGNPLEHLSSALDLTADQKAKLQPIIDQSKPQIESIHQEAMEKMRTIMENAGTQIRPLLTPQQQTKFDAMKKAHEDMHKAMQEMHDAEKK